MQTKRKVTLLCCAQCVVWDAFQPQGASEVYYISADISKQKELLTTLRNCPAMRFSVPKHVKQKILVDGSDGFTIGVVCVCVFFEFGIFVALYWQWILPPRFLCHIQDMDPTGIASFLPKTRFHGCSRWSGFLDFAACLCECLGRQVIW